MASLLIPSADPYSFSSFSSVDFETIFSLVAPSSSASELPRASDLSLDTY